MKAEEDSYKKIIGILRNSRPEPDRPEEISSVVMDKILSGKHKTIRTSEIIDSMFGWIYIGWVRRSLAVAAIILIVVFIYQQAFILKQVKDLSKQMVSITTGTITSPIPIIDRKLTIFKISAGLSSKREIKIPEAQMRQFIESYEELQSGYNELIKIINEDPELKKYIEKKLYENGKSKSNL